MKASEARELACSFISPELENWRINTLARVKEAATEGRFYCVTEPFPTIYQGFNYGGYLPHEHPLYYIQIGYLEALGYKVIGNSYDFAFEITWGQP
jgi:hypothetical protein